MECDFISVGMFRDCYNLTNIKLPKNLIKIESEAFMNTSISSVVIPDSVTALGRQCFKGCTSLTTVNISDNSELQLVSFGLFDGCIWFAYLSEFKAKYYLSENGAMYNVNKTKMIIYPPASPSLYFALANSIVSIEETAFIGCANLQSILIPDGALTNIGNNAFENCVSLMHINIPRSVTTIGANAFKGCHNLKCGSVMFENKAEEFVSLLVSSGIPRVALKPCICATCIDLPGHNHNMEIFMMFVFEI